MYTELLRSVSVSVRSKWEDSLTLRNKLWERKADITEWWSWPFSGFGISHDGLSCIPARERTALNGPLHKKKKLFPEIPVSYGTQSFIPLSLKGRYLMLSWMGWIQPTSLHSTSLRSTSLHATSVRSTSPHTRFLKYRLNLGPSILFISPPPFSPFAFYSLWSQKYDSGTEWDGGQRI